ncbi:olfactory receptor 1020 [Camelus ferus]|nr:olfactory receptor 1020 [Camelus ferus]
MLLPAADAGDLDLCKKSTGKMTPGELALASGNHTPVTQFILLGFSNYPDLQELLFGGFLLIYAVTVLLAYDRFVAIRRPLHYSSVMTKGTCLQLVAASYTFGGANSAIETGNVFTLPFCGPNHLTHYFCDIKPLLRLACANTATAGLVLYILSALVTLLPAALILTSYSLVLVAIGRMRSAAGKEKALSTCASHFLAIAIFYSTVIFTYVQPRGSTDDTSGQIVSVFYTVIIPMLNPFIYSLQNKEVKDALQGTLQGSIAPC